MKIGLVGKPNVGKSTFFAAATLVDATIGNYPFTTIDANVGVAAVRVPDPGPDFGKQSAPRHGSVVGATRYVPIELVDVAGLVPGAHQGRGLGNKFLNDLARADALLHVVDASGGTDAEGNVVGLHSHDPAEDIRFLEDEVDLWIHGILAEGWDRMAKKTQQENGRLEAVLGEKLQGIGIGEVLAHKALRDAGLASKRPIEVSPKELRSLATALRKASKPMAVVLNKADQADELTLRRLAGTGTAIPASAQSELALRKGAASGLLAYVPGAGAFEVKGQANPLQAKGLDYIRSHVLTRFGSTGVQDALEHAAFKLLGLIPVFPVEDESKLTDKDGRVLPDCHLVPAGTTARQLAYRVHTDLGEHFIRAVDCRTHRAIGAEHALKAGDVVKVHAAK